MLRISLVETATQCRVIVEGRMAGTGLTKLRMTCARLKPNVLAKCLFQEFARRTKKELSDIIDTSPAESTNVQVLTRRESDSASQEEKNAPPPMDR